MVLSFHAFITKTVPSQSNMRTADCTHLINNLFDGVQANDARALLVSSCIPGFASYVGETDRRESARDLQQ